MRWITLLGRLGTVTLMAGLALGLVWLIPSAQMGITFGGENRVLPEQYQTSYTGSTLTPQNGLSISIESNGTLIVYFLNIFQWDLQDWARTWVEQQFPNLTESEVWLSTSNMTVLNAFLESHSDVVLWKSDATTELSKEFFPTTVSNATIIIANPSVNYVTFQYEIKTVTSLAPKNRLLLSAQLLIPIGVVLAIP